MKNYTYDFEILTITTQFMAAIDDIIVKRFTKNKEPLQEIKVRVVYAPKQRVLLDLLDKAQNIQLPVVACYITGINRDASRITNKIQPTLIPSIKYSNQQRQDSQPVPIDITYGVTIMTRFQQDMDQILCNLLSVSNPYFVISWRTPNRPDHEIRSQVIWSGTTNLSYPYDINASQVARVVADLTYTVKAWLFQSAPMDGGGLIYTIHSLYSNEYPGFPCDYTVDQLTINPLRTDYFKIQGTPPQPIVVEPYWAKVGTSTQFSLIGRGMKVINNVYLSGQPVNLLSTEYNPFSAVPNLSANYPPITAYKLSASMWSYNQEDRLSFVVPPLVTTGFVDVILEGPVGYGSLVQFVKTNTFNPFVSGSDKFNEFVPYQVPYQHGIQIVG